MSELPFDPRLAAFLPPLSDEEKAKLEEDIRNAGRVIMPVDLALIDGRYVIVDGHHRYEIAVRLQVPWQYNVLQHVHTVEQAMEFMCSRQAARRNVGPRMARYLRGKHYLLTRKRPAFAVHQTDHYVHVEDLARSYGISAPTLHRDAEFARTVDELSVSPEGDSALRAQVLDDKVRLAMSDLEAARHGGGDWVKVVRYMLADGVGAEEARRRVMAATCIPAPFLSEGGAGHAAFDEGSGRDDDDDDDENCEGAVKDDDHHGQGNEDRGMDQEAEHEHSLGDDIRVARDAHEQTAQTSPPFFGRRPEAPIIPLEHLADVLLVLRSAARGIAEGETAVRVLRALHHRYPDLVDPGA